MVLILFFQVCFPVGFEKSGALSACLSLQMVLDAERRDREEKKEREREYVGVFQLENLTHYNWDKIMFMADWKTKILFPEILGVWSLLRSLLDGKENWTPHQSKAVIWGTHWVLRDFDMVFRLPWEHPNPQLLAVLVGNLFCGRDTGESRN